MAAFHTDHSRHVICTSLTVQGRYTRAGDPVKVIGAIEYLKDMDLLSMVDQERGLDSSCLNYMDPHACTMSQAMV